tara:strand:- start:196 stop:348 length:153 start_codon:yes stop_codon:yes gene_type:complete
MFGGLAGRLKTPARISGDAVIHPWGVTVNPPNFYRMKYVVKLTKNILYEN